MLAAIDNEIYQVVVLVLLGAGSLVKSLLERKRKGEMEESSDGGESVGRRRRAETRRRLAGLEEEQQRAPAKDPWQILLEGGDPQTEEGRAAKEEELFVEELPFETVLVEEPLVSAARATPEVSIEGEALGGLSSEGASYDQGTIPDDPWDPAERIRSSVFEDIEQSVFTDISEHVKADMGAGVRGEASMTQSHVHRKRHARRGWRAAVVAAEVLGAPLALRDSTTLPAGIRTG